MVYGEQAGVVLVGRGGAIPLFRAGSLYGLSEWSDLRSVSSTGGNPLCIVIIYSVAVDGHDEMLLAKESPNLRSPNQESRLQLPA